MGKKDIGLKSYLQDKERYADLWNGSVFQGRQVVRAEELQEITPVHSKADQNGTLVVYWGEEGWQGTRSLHEMIDFGMEGTIMGQELRKLIPEYPLHILDLTRFNHTEYFKTELRPLFEMFQRRGNKEEFVRYVEENEENWKMDDESWHVLSQLTDSQDLKYLIGKKNQKERKEKSMCKAIEDLKKDARAEGKAEFIIELLEEYGTVPDRLRRKILEQKNLTVLNGWFKLALRIDSVDEFMVQGRCNQ